MEDRRDAKRNARGENASSKTETFNLNGRRKRTQGTQKSEAQLCNPFVHLRLKYNLAGCFTEEEIPIT